MKPDSEPKPCTAVCPTCGDTCGLAIKHGEYHQCLTNKCPAEWKAVERVQPEPASFTEPEPNVVMTPTHLLRCDNCGEGFQWPVTFNHPKFCPTCGNIVEDPNKFRKLMEAIARASYYTVVGENTIIIGHHADQIKVALDNCK